MADIKILAPFILSFEGGFVNDPADAGGATNKGVTLATWRKVGYDKNRDGVIDVKDLKLISDEDAISVTLKPHYWDKIKAGEIKDQSVANILADWAWGSGPGTAAKQIQRIVGVTADGVVGPKTIAAINKYEPKMLFNRIKAERERFFKACVANRPANAKFLRGWLRRLDSIGYGYLVLNNGKKISF